TLLHTGLRRGSVSAVGAVAGTRFFPLRMRSALGRILMGRRLPVPIRSRRCRRGRGRSIATDGSNAPAPTCSAWGRGGRQGFLVGGGVFVVRGVHGALRVGVWWECWCCDDQRSGSPAAALSRALNSRTTRPTPSLETV